MEWAQTAGPEGIGGDVFCGEETESQSSPALEAWDWDGEFIPFEHFEVDSDGDPRVPDGAPVDVARMTYSSGTVLYVAILSQGATVCIAATYGEDYFLGHVEGLTESPAP